YATLFRAHRLLDVDVDARRKVDAHERVHRLRRRVEDVDQTLVRAHLEVLARVLVLVRRTDYAVNVLLGGQRHRSDDRGTGARHRLDDLARAGVDRLLFVGLEPDADLLFRHSFLPSRPRPTRYRLLGAGLFGLPSITSESFCM